MQKIVIILNLLCLFQISQCAKVLLVFPVASRSHHRLGDAFAKGLLKYGFDVTIISPFETKNPPKNFTEIVLTGIEIPFTDEKDGKRQSRFEWDNMPPFLYLPFLTIMGEKVIDSAMNHPNVQNLLKSNQKFDVVIVDNYFAVALQMIAVHFDAPLITFSSVGSNVWISTIAGNPNPPSYVPDVMLNYGTDMTFFQRMCNFLMNILQLLNTHLLVHRRQAQLAKKYFPNYLELDVILYNVSLVFLNSHESFSIPVPFVPNMISVGGFHISPPQELPKGLKEFMDDAKEGVIYFSLGSNLDPSDMPPKTLATLLKVLGKRKEKVLWKWDQQNLSNKPANMMISKWFPQMDVLAHPNLKLFITHCGLLSITETIYHGVPILGLPVFGDQHLNALRAVTLEFGKSIRFSQITEENLKDSLDELQNNSRYKEMAKYRSRVFHDRPQKPMDLAAYWVDYIITHRGAPHLRVAGIDLPWYKYLMLDVVAFLFLTVLLSLYLVSKLFRLICCRWKSKSRDKLKMT